MKGAAEDACFEGEGARSKLTEGTDLPVVPDEGQTSILCI